MKKLFAVLTTVAVVAVVIVVASYLIATAQALLRANRNLTHLNAGLETVRDNTAPLAQQLPAVNGAALTLLGRLRTLDDLLRNVLPPVPTRV